MGVYIPFLMRTDMMYRMFCFIYTFRIFKWLVGISIYLRSDDAIVVDDKQKIK